MGRVTRLAALKSVGAVLLLPACAARNPNALYVGSTRLRENTVIAEIFAGALDERGISVARRFGFADEAAAITALERGDIDVLPAHAPMTPAASGVVWLAPAPAGDACCLVTSQYAAEQYWMLVLSTCASLAPRLRLAATRDFLASGALEGLTRRYGGFKFGKILACESGEQYDALNRGDADVANGIATDAKIGESQLVVLGDDKHFWSHDNIVPAIRAAALHAFPQARHVLNGVSRTLTQYAVQQMNAHLDLLSLQPSDVAQDFLHTHRT